MRDVIDVLIIVALALQMLTNTAILLGVFAIVVMLMKQFKKSTPTNSAIAQATSPQIAKQPVNPCDHCGTELGDPASSRIMGEGTVLIYQCTKCSLPTERQA